jgi:hypothetical protein
VIRPAPLGGELLPDWQPWVSVSGRWWAAYRATLTHRQIDAGCLPLLHADDQEELAAAIRAQEELRARLTLPVQEV